MQCALRGGGAGGAGGCVRRRPGPWSRRVKRALRGGCWYGLYLRVRKAGVVQTVWSASVERWQDHNIICELELAVKALFGDCVFLSALKPPNSPPMKVPVGAVTIIVANHFFETRF